METADLTIQGMHCAACAQPIEARHAAESGVKATRVSDAGRSARVLFDPAGIDRPRLVEAVERAGYRVVAAC